MLKLINSIIQVSPPSSVIFADELDLYDTDTLEFFLPAASKPVLLSAEHTMKEKKWGRLELCGCQNNGDIQMCPEEVQEQAIPCLRWNAGGAWGWSWASPELSDIVTKWLILSLNTDFMSKAAYPVFTDLCCSPWECGMGGRESRNFLVPFPWCFRCS